MTPAEGAVIIVLFWTLTIVVGWCAHELFMEWVND